MIYKRHELSLSLNGTKVMHIARNAAGNVIFREESLESLKLAIDKAEEARLRAEQDEANKKANKSQPAQQKISTTPKPALVPAAETVEEKLPEPQPIIEEQKISTEPIRRGPDGKFISKSQTGANEDDEPKKKVFGIF